MANFEAAVTFQSTHEAVFDFLVRPANALAISPPGIKLSILEAPDQIELGSRVEFQIGGFGPPQRFLHEIIHFEPPYRFTEAQIEGPLKHFVHEHVLEMAAASQVTVIDRIEFEPPEGLAGFLLTPERILESLKETFMHRHEALKKFLEQP